MKIRVIKANRGFWTDLFEEKFSRFCFVENTVKSFEDSVKNSKSIFWWLSQRRIFDKIGYFQIIKVQNSDADMYFSYNRFLDTDRPYILALENPLALVHYRPARARSVLGKKRLRKAFQNNIKAIVCISEACEKTLSKYFVVPKDLRVVQIYPFIKDRISLEKLNKKTEQKPLECLFISSMFFLKGGRELLEVIKRNRWDLDKVHFSIITSLKYLNQNVIDEIQSLKSVSLYDFKFSKKDLNAFYEKANILINPTRKDSFSLVTLEALMYGCAFISTDMYAISEMVEDGFNGYLIQPAIKYWNNDYTKNELSKDKLLALESDYCQAEVVDFISDKINYFLNNKEELIRMQYNSFDRANTKFSEKSIKTKWEEVVK